MQVIVMLTVSLSLTGTCDLKCHFGTLEPGYPLEVAGKFTVQSAGLEQGRVRLW